MDERSIHEIKTWGRGDRSKGLAEVQITQPRDHLGDGLLVMVGMRMPEQKLGGKKAF